MMQHRSQPAVLFPLVFFALLAAPARCAADAAAPPESAAPPRVDIEAGQDAVILEEILTIDIASPTSASVRSVNRVKVLTARGADENDVVSIEYLPCCPVRDLRAAITLPGGKRTDLKKQQFVDEAAFGSYELYSDSRYRSIEFPGVVPGTILEYSYQQVYSNLFYLPDRFLFQGDTPARSRLFAVRTPASFQLRTHVRGNPEYSQREENGMVVQEWRAHDVPAFRMEARMPPERDVLPLVEIFLKEIVWDQHHIDASTWNGIAQWEWTLTRDKIEPDPEVATKAKELTAGVTDAMEMTRRLYEFVQKNINYVAIELGIGGYEPHTNAAVYKNRYGDCKDKAALLLAMLKAVGLRGYPVSILTRDKGVKDRDYPTPGSNHAIVAVQAVDGYLFMDPTYDQLTPFGDLPWEDQGANVLVVKEDGTGDMVETPIFPPERNRLRWTVTAEIGPAGDLRGTYVIEVYGERRRRFAALLEGARQSERDDAMAALAASVCPGAVLEKQEVSTPTKPEEPLRVTIHFKVPRFVTRAGSLEIFSPHLVRFPGLTGIASDSSRHLPVFFNFLSSDESEVRLTLPPGRTLKRVPAGGTVEGGGVVAITSYEVSPVDGRDVLLVKRTVKINKREIPVEEYPVLRKALSALGEEEARAVTLVPAS